MLMLLFDDFTNMNENVSGDFNALNHFLLIMAGIFIEMIFIYHPISNLSLIERLMRAHVRLTVRLT
jgi:hypothetical protein